LGGAGGTGGAVTGGGLVGDNTGVISNAYSLGNVTATAGSPAMGGTGGTGGNGGAAGGGSAGANGDGVNGGAGGAGASALVGGLFGSHATSLVTNTYSVGVPTATRTSGASGGAGGIAGVGGSGGNDGGVGTSGASTALEYMGGIVGNPVSGTWASSYWDTTTSGTSFGAGNATTPTNTTGKNTTQMKQQATFTGWDFTILPIWKIAEASTYPYFNYQYAPDAPTNIVAVGGNGQATITFTPPANTGGTLITSYTVTSSPGGFTATGGSSPITITGLTNGVTYTFTVTATNIYGTSISSATSNAVTPATVPGSPIIGTATHGNGQATITFSAPVSNGGSAITSYTVTSSGGHTATGGSSPLIVTGLTNGVAYTFTVTATNAVGTGNASASSNSVTPATVPNSPIIGTATAGNGQATITFTPPVNNGGSAITSYTVTSSPGGLTATGGTSPITITGLTNGVAYTFTVTATNAEGVSVASATTNSVTPATIPDAPTIGVATEGNGQATITFTPGNNGGSNILYYTVTSNPGGFIVHGGSSPITVTGLSNGTAYTFTVTATNAYGTSSASVASNAVTPATAPDAPTGVVAVRGNGQASVSFTPGNNGGSAITSYTVTSSGGQTASGGSSPIIVTGLSNGATYTFTVTATNAYGTSSASVVSDPITPATVPGAPTIGTATAANGEATITFSPPISNGGLPITSYTVTSSGGQTATGGTSPIIVLGLVNGTTYTFTVTASNAVGTSTASASSNSVVPANVPDAPTIGTATSGNGQATITFTPGGTGGSAITSYTVTSSGGQTASGGSSPITVLGLVNGTTYTFTVTATNIFGTSTASATSNSVTPATVPDAPIIGTATAANGQATVTFSAPVSNGGSTITSYTVTSSGGQTATGGSSPITVLGLTNGVSYTFTVVAINSVGSSTASAVSNSIIPATIPDAPTIGVATGGNGQATITFTPPINNGGSAITSYTVTSSGGHINSAGSSPITVTGLSNGTTYTFTVTATNAFGTSTASVASNAVTPATVPDAPTNVAGSIADSSAYISWSAPAYNGGSAITSYTVTSSPGGLTANSTTTNVIFTGLTNGVTYTFTVTAINAEGSSVSSGSSAGITPASVPGVPTNLAATVDDSSINLSWTAPVSNGGSALTDYVVQYKLTTGGTWTTFADGVSTVPAATITSLSNNNSYDFRVYAKNIVGTGLSSVEVSATPGAPAQVLIQSFSDLIVPGISTLVRITNEGSTAYEYQYTWCVTDSALNLCGGGNDIFSSTAAKLIQPLENFDTVLNSTVPIAGNYYFHINVDFGSDSSQANQSFTAVNETVVVPPGGGGGGGGGGGTSVKPTVPGTSCIGTDFNQDGKINSIDFSIMLAFWKVAPPFKNACADVNSDKQVNSVDFSILLYQWGKNPALFKKP
jgi:hypothetical protein